MAMTVVIHSEQLALANSESSGICILCSSTCGFNGQLVCTGACTGTFCGSGCACDDPNNRRCTCQ